MFTALQRFRLLSLTVAWVAGVVSILLAEPSGPVAAAGAYAFGLFILLTVARLRWDSLVILTVLGGVTWFLVGAVPGPEEILAGGERVLIFAALIPTMALVRATAMTMPSVHATQQRLARLPENAFAGGQQLAAHVFGGIINTGAFALLSAVLPSNAPEAAARLCRGGDPRHGIFVGLVAIFIAFAIGQTFVDPVYAWMAIAIGAVSAALFTIVTLLVLTRGLAGRASPVACLSGPVASRLAIVLASVLAVALLFGLTALSAVVVVMPLLVALQLSGTETRHG